MIDDASRVSFPECETKVLCLSPESEGKNIMRAGAAKKRSNGTDFIFIIRTSEKHRFRKLKNVYDRKRLLEKCVKVETTQSFTGMGCS